MRWINFLHIYQPPTLEKETLVRITREAYFNIIHILKKNPNYKITLNITACLTEYLNQVGFTKLIDELKILIKKHQVELTGSAAFHPLMPLIPAKEAERQIKVNAEINRKYFGKLYHPAGFYLPEMAYSPAVAKIIKKNGYDWIILDEIAYNGKINRSKRTSKINYQIKYIDQHSSLAVVFRQRNISKTFVPETISQLLKLSAAKRPEVVIAATDGELYGHKYVDWSGYHEQILKNKDLQTMTISAYLKSLKKNQFIKPLSSSWESTPLELKKNIPYSLWYHPRNKIHRQLWSLANYALKLNYQYKNDGNHFASRLHMERGLASCTFWWASGKDFKLFDPPAWNPTEIEKGALELLRSIRSLNSLPAKQKIKAEKIFLEIHKLIWTKHWLKNKVKK